MGKEYGKSGSAKQLILMILEGYAGDAEGIAAETFYKKAAKLAGIDQSTVEKYVHEQIGQVNIRDGRIIVVPDAMLLSTTHRAVNNTDDGNGRGISNKIKKWHFDGFRNRRRQ